MQRDVDLRIDDLCDELHYETVEVFDLVFGAERPVDMFMSELMCLVCLRT